SGDDGPVSLLDPGCAPWYSGSCCRDFGGCGWAARDRAAWESDSDEFACPAVGSGCSWEVGVAPAAGRSPWWAGCSSEVSAPRSSICGVLEADAVLVDTRSDAVVGAR